MPLPHGSITAVRVEIDHYAESTVRVTGGLVEGERIVSAGVHKLDASMRVRAWDAQL